MEDARALTGPVVVAACLANVERRTVLRWRPIWDRVAGRLLYDDITLDVFSILALRVLCRVVVERSGKPPVRLRVERDLMAR